MKLVHKNIEKHLNFDENFFQVLIIENQKEYFSLIKQLIYQANGEDGDWVLSHDGKILQIEKSMAVLSDFFEFTIAGRKIEGEINSKLMSVFKEGDLFQEVQNINSQINLLGERLIEEVELPIEMNSEITFSTLIKLLSFKIRQEENLIDKLSTWVDINIKLKNIKIFVFVNLQFVLDEEEFTSFVKYLNYLQIGVLNIASIDSEVFKDAEKTIIDKDLCEI